MSNVAKLFEGDKRCQALLEALEKTCYERGAGIPIPSILGILELLKTKIIEDA